jgi:hypothetical protein
LAASPLTEPCTPSVAAHCNLISMMIILQMLKCLCTIWPAGWCMKLLGYGA